MPGNKCFLALSAGMKCLQVPCPNLGMCHDLLLAQGEMRHLASVTWLFSSGVGSDRGSLPVGIVLWPFRGSGSKLMCLEHHVPQGLGFNLHLVNVICYCWLRKTVAAERKEQFRRLPRGRNC